LKSATSKSIIFGNNHSYSMTSHFRRRLRLQRNCGDARRVSADGCRSVTSSFNPQGLKHLVR
jgi:hypothetical protein